jgi:hypothetical protein
MFKAQFPSGTCTRKELMDALIQFSFKNVQFGLLVKDSAPFRVEVTNRFGLTITDAEWQEVVRAATINIVAEEHSFPLGRYPENLSIQTPDEMDAALDAVFGPENTGELLSIQDAKIFCIGSCFATNVAYYLQKIGATVSTAVIAENINSPRNNVDLFRYFATQQASGLLTSQKLLKNNEIASIRENFLQSDVLVLTLGCAFSLIDAATGAPIDKLQKGAAFDNPTVEEIKAQLAEIFGIVKASGFRKIFVTVSPVPLAGTLLHGGNPYVSDAASKAKLRAAIDEICASDSLVIYFPSFEAFRQLAMHTHFPTFGLADGYSRHVNPDIVEKVVNRFTKKYFG